MPPLLDRGYLHNVVDRYAPSLIGHAVSSRRAHGLATRDPPPDRGVGATAPPAGGGEAPCQKARWSRGRVPGGGAQGQTAGDQPSPRRPVGFPGVVQEESRREGWGEQQPFVTALRMNIRESRLAGNH